MTIWSCRIRWFSRFHHITVYLYKLRSKTDSRNDLFSGLTYLRSYVKSRYLCGAVGCALGINLRGRASDNLEENYHTVLPSILLQWVILGIISWSDHRCNLSLFCRSSWRYDSIILTCSTACTGVEFIPNPLLFHWRNNQTWSREAGGNLNYTKFRKANSQPVRHERIGEMRRTKVRP